MYKNEDVKGIKMSIVNGKWEMGNEKWGKRYELTEKDFFIDLSN